MSVLNLEPIFYQSDPHRLENFKHSFPKGMRDARKAIVVRHPMERLVAVYR